MLVSAISKNILACGYVTGQGREAKMNHPFIFQSTAGMSLRHAAASE
jgi:hypothetical protein